LSVTCPRSSPRVAQAVGAAALTPTSLGLILYSVPAERRAGAVRLWATSGAVAAALGPLAGGVLVEVSCRWAFLINMPVGVLLIIAAIQVLPVVPPRRDGPGADVLGAVLLAVAVGGLTAALVRGPEWGWVSAETLAIGAVAVAAGGWFVRDNTRHPAPLLDRAVLGVPRIGRANIATVLFNASFAGGLLGLILYLRQVWGWPALDTGMAIAPGPMVVPVFAWLGQVVSRRVTTGLITLLGNVFWVAGWR
jgi:hypothetical protein